MRRTIEIEIQELLDRQLIHLQPLEDKKITLISALASVSPAHTSGLAKLATELEVVQAEINRIHAFQSELGGVLDHLSENG